MNRLVEQEATPEEITSLAQSQLASINTFRGVCFHKMIYTCGIFGIPIKRLVPDDYILKSDEAEVAHSEVKDGEMMADTFNWKTGEHFLKIHTDGPSDSHVNGYPTVTTKVVFGTDGEVPQFNPNYTRSDFSSRTRH